jgi:hypothetical protein
VVLRFGSTVSLVVRSAGIEVFAEVHHATAGFCNIRYLQPVEQLKDNDDELMLAYSPGDDVVRAAIGKSMWEF